MQRSLVSLSFAAALALVATAAPAQQPDSAALLAAQTQALRTFAMMDGVWRGPATSLLPDGSRRTITQTERIGPFLGRAYSLHSHAGGLLGVFAFTPSADGYVWEIPAGPAKIRYTATIRNGELHEVGDRIVAGGEPQLVFEMRLQRIGDTDWPAAGAVRPR